MKERKMEGMNLNFYEIKNQLPGIHYLVEKRGERSGRRV